jgi:hypothetical protein
VPVPPRTPERQREEQVAITEARDEQAIEQGAVETESERTRLIREFTEYRAAERAAQEEIDRAELRKRGHGERERE